MHLIGHCKAVRQVATRDKRQSDGTWLLENTHPGEVQFEFEDGDGHPSRWNTLRALRVLDWYDRTRAEPVTGLPGPLAPHSSPDEARDHADPRRP